MKGPLAGAIGEGMGDVLSVINNDDPVVGEYSSTDPAGIRSASYENYPNTYGDIVGTEVHADGEVYGAIGWDLWKQYKAAGLGQGAILADLVNGMNFTPSTPTYEQMRDGILNGLSASGQGARQCMVWSSFAKYGVGVGAVGKAVGKAARVSESFAKPASC
jgi:extracellular elastinolytic metalloproteinase